MILLFFFKALHKFATDSPERANAETKAGMGAKSPVTIKRSTSPPLTAISSVDRVSPTNAGCFRHAELEIDDFANIPPSDSTKTVRSVYSTVTIQPADTVEVGSNENGKNNRRGALEMKVADSITVYFDADGVKRGKAEPLPLDGYFPSSESFAPDEEMLPWMAARLPTTRGGGNESNNANFLESDGTWPRQMDRALSSEDVKDLVRRRKEAKKILQREAMGGEVQQEIYAWSKTIGCPGEIR